MSQSQHEAFDAVAMKINTRLQAHEVEEIHAILQNANNENMRSNYQTAHNLALDALHKLTVSTEQPDHDGANDDGATESTTHAVLGEALARSLHILGTSARYRGEYDQAEKYYQQSYQVSLSRNDLSGQARALGNLGIVKGHRNLYAEEMELTQQALRLDTKGENKRGIAMWQNNIGMIYGQLGDYSKAMEYFMTALELDEEIDNEVGVAIRHGNIGTVHQYLEEYEQALEHYLKALEIDQRLGNRHGIALYYSNVGLVHGYLKNLSLAIEYFNRALAIDEELKNERGRAIRLANLGDIYLELEEYDAALEHLHKALSIDTAINNKRGCALRLSGIGATYLRRNNSEQDIADAHDYLHQGLDAMTEIGDKHHVARIHRELSHLYEVQGKLTDALHHYKIFHTLEKEVTGEQAKKRVQSAEQQKIIRQQEREFELAQTTAITTLKVTNKVLHRVLPEVIATRIVSGEEEIADYFPSVSILFADIKGFTAISAGMSAQMVVRLLKFVFGHIDIIMRKHGCEKIKTIGDGYMAIAGAPLAATDHAWRITLAALEILEPFQLPDEFLEYLGADFALGIRIGLHCGPVVAGVVGEDRFVYDVYSDAVNTASRMESYGEAGKVHVSEDFIRELAIRNGQMTIGQVEQKHSLTINNCPLMIIPRGEVEIKGKGMMKTYFLERAENPSTEAGKA